MRFGLIVSTATNTRPARWRRTGHLTRVSFRQRATRWGFRWERRLPRWSVRPIMPRLKPIGFRHLWGQAKREELVETAEAEPDNLYNAVEPVLPLGLPLVRTAVSEGYFDWPLLPELFPVSFPGVKTSRDGFLVDTDLDQLKERAAAYFNADLSHEEIARRYPGVMKTTAGFNARSARDLLLARGGAG